MLKLNVVKVGGAIIEEEAKLRFPKDFAAPKGAGNLGTWGRKKASLWAEKMGIPVQMKDGRRITDAATLELISGDRSINHCGPPTGFWLQCIGIMEQTATPFAQINVQ